jgi:hypothetical protein
MEMRELTIRKRDGVGKAGRAPAPGRPGSGHLYGRAAG